MKALRRMVFIFASTLVVAKLVDTFLRSSTGKRILRATGFQSLLTEEGVQAAKRYSKTATGLLVGTVLTLRAHGQDEDGRRKSSMVQTAENAAELVMAAGALTKVVADFLREEQELREAKIIS